MKVNLNDWLKKSVNIRTLSNGEKYQGIREVLTCNDGTTLSIQASSAHYCRPRKSYIDLYDANEEPEFFDYYAVEVWEVSCDTPSSWKEYGDQENNPYAYIPVQMVEEFIEEHGGIKGVNTPEVKLRYLVVEVKEKWYPSWNTSSGENFRYIQEEPKLQYSLDGGNVWIDVETVVQKADS